MILWTAKICCDGKGCFGSAKETAHHQSTADCKTWASADAARRGFELIRGKHYCRECAKIEKLKPVQRRRLAVFAGVKSNTPIQEIP